MSEKSIQNLLYESFSVATKENWKQIASAEIEGKNPMEELRWTAPDGSNFLPYYDRNDVSSLEYQLQPSKNSFSDARHWCNLPRITILDELSANQTALDHLSHGADGILFDLKKITSINFNALLEKIDWPYCEVSFTNASDAVLRDLCSYVLKKKYNPDSLTGVFFWEPRIKNTREITERFKNYKNYKALGLVVQPSSPVQEIVEGLSKAVNCIEELTSAEINIEEFFNRVAFSFSVGTNFLLEIAKLKAFRMLWFQIAQAYGLKNYQSSHLHLHVRSESWITEKYQPNGNMLKSTMAAMAAALGGCDSLTVLAEDESNVMMNRIARNVSTILLEESYLSKVTDPTAGSYALENITHEIAQKAWNKFSSRESS